MTDRSSVRTSGPVLATALCLGLGISCTNAGPKWAETSSGTFKTVTQDGGPTLGYSSASGVTLVVVDGFAFKDLSRDGMLDPYEDWRLPAEDRAKDLASKMSVEQIAGLMLYSNSSLSLC